MNLTAAIRLAAADYRFLDNGHDVTEREFISEARSAGMINHYGVADMLARGDISKTTAAAYRAVLDATERDIQAALAELAR